MVRRVWNSPRLLPILSVGCVLTGGVLLTSAWGRGEAWWQGSTMLAQTSLGDGAIAPLVEQLSGRPVLNPLPPAEEVWQCEVVVVGGSLGGVAAANHAMRSGAVTCLIEVTPWLGGQISSQGVSALDESLRMRHADNFSASWERFKVLLQQQFVNLPAWTGIAPTTTVREINSCWVGELCFPPEVGAIASEQLLQDAAQFAPGSQWSVATAFKGAEFDLTGQDITAIYAVRRVPMQADYRPTGRLSEELSHWYSWTDDELFDKIPIRLEAFPDRPLIVIDATDTGELIAWADVPYRTGSEAQDLLGETHAPSQSNPDCTQAFTFPFAIALHDDGGQGMEYLSQIDPVFNRHEHTREYSMDGFPMFAGTSLFHYRRIVSKTRNNPFYGAPAPGDISMINWTAGNDWNWMDPPLLLSPEKLADTGQYQNWLGGLSWSALGYGETHALLFSQWLLETQGQSGTPLAHLMGDDSPMGTQSGLSMMPYIREGRRILGRDAYGQPEFMLREADIRNDQSGGRDLRDTAVAVTHYSIDIHGCRYRNWQPSWEAQSAASWENVVHPVVIPLASLIPQEVDNLLVGGKGIAVSHIVNAVTRVHYGEWSIGGAAGATAGWLVTQHPDLSPADIVPENLMPQLQQHLRNQGLRHQW